MLNITKKSTAIFNILELNQDFLKEDPKCWPLNKQYVANQTKIGHLKCVNDTAERGER